MAAYAMPQLKRLLEQLKELRVTCTLQQMYKAE